MCRYFLIYFSCLHISDLLARMLISDSKACIACNEKLDTSLKLEKAVGG